MAWKMAFCFAWALALGANTVLAQAIPGKGTPVVRPGSSTMGVSGKMATAALGTGGGVIRLRQLTGLGPRYTMRSPDTSGGGSRHGLNREWVELGIQYDSEPDWIDDLSVQFYALLKSRETGDLTLLKGTVNYVDVARGRGHLGCAYIRPAALLRFGELIGIAVEMMTKGEVVATLSEGRLGPSKPLPMEWWKSAKLAPKEGYIVEKSKTPFAFITFDEYEAVK